MSFKPLPQVLHHPAVGVLAYVDHWLPLAYIYIYISAAVLASSHSPFENVTKIWS